MSTSVFFRARRVDSAKPHNLVALYLLAVLGPLTVDLYLPALPMLQDDLDASTVATQATLTATTIGFALGQLIVGNWSDAVGRRAPLLLSTSLHVVASAAIAISPGIEWALSWRFVQGMGAAGGAVIAAAIVRDLFDGHSFVRILARIAVISGLAPVVAPLVGAQFMEVTGWRGLFVFVACYGAAITVVAMLALQETLPVERRLQLRPRILAKRYRQLLTDTPFVGVALIGGLIVSGVFTLVTASSYLLQQTYGLGPQGYSLAFAGNAIAFVVGTQTAARVLRRVSPRTLLSITLPLSTAAGFAIIPASSTGVIGITAATVLFMLGAGLSVPCLQVIGMGRNGHQAGTAAALLGATNFGLAGLTSPLVGAMGVESAIPMGVMMGCTQLIALVLLYSLVRPGLSSVN
jgi:DHA1 family bicyclomycin/chloramphenicol resistance-like MFS transporter